MSAKKLSGNLSEVKDKSLLVRGMASSVKSTSRKTRCLKRSTELLRSQDLFGPKVEFTYKGRRSYQTDIGGFVSIFVKGIVGFFIFWELYVIIKRKHPQVSTKYQLNDFVQGNSLGISAGNGWNPMETGFDFGVGIYTRSNTNAGN